MISKKPTTTQTTTATKQDYVDQARLLATKVIEVTKGITDEANLRHELEKALEVSCNNLGIPESKLIPLFFDSIEASSRHQNKTWLLFAEWKRLFGQVIGVQSDRFKELLREQGNVHKRKYEDDIPVYLFALNTYIALIAKLVAALSLPNSSRNIADTTTPIKGRTEALEMGLLFRDAGISNMLSGDFFSWYVDDIHWGSFSTEIDSLVQKLSMIDFDVSKKSPDSTRDLFKGIYQVFVPGALRHASGEFYTPDWLAGYALDTIGWQTECGLMDPTCGSGTFLLEALRRRLNGGTGQHTIEDLLKDLYGIDLNPLAVLTAKGSLVVYLAPYLKPDHSVRIPVFLADTINSANSENGIYHHDLQTERGIKSFQLSLGVSVVEYLHIPKLDTNNTHHAQMSERSKQITHSGTVTAHDYKTLDDLASKIVGIHASA